MSDRAKAAVDALKEPGMRGPDRSAPHEEETRAPERRSGPERGSGPERRQNPAWPTSRFAGFPASGAATGRTAIFTALESLVSREHAEHKRDGCSS
jgi:hypothetical protein